MQLLKPNNDTPTSPKKSGGLSKKRENPNADSKKALKKPRLDHPKDAENQARAENGNEEEEAHDNDGEEDNNNNKKQTRQKSNSSSPSSSTKTSTRRRAK